MSDGPGVPHQSQRSARLAYTALALAALGLITTANRLGAWCLAAIDPKAAVLADLCLPSLLLCLAAYVAVRPARPFAGIDPQAPRRPLLRLGLGWLALWFAASAVAALVAGHWIRYTTGTSAIVCFTLVGPLQEEFLYRGALFELAARAWPASRRWTPVVATTVPFALQHFQFHHYRPTPAALLQVAFTVPMGIVFGRLRQISGSLWPGWIVHVLTNVMGT